MNKPLVTAIITTHNRISLLPRAIESVLGQTYNNIECIVVSDASVDGTNEYCQQRSDIKFIAISQEDSKGANHARNVGIHASQGEYIAFLDDDDYWLPTKIEKQVALIQEKKCDLVYCGCRPEFVQADGSVLYEDWLPRTDGDGDFSSRIFSRIWVLNCAMMVRRDAFEKYGYLNENLRAWCEYEFTIRLAQHSNFYFVNEVLLVFRVDKREKQRLTNNFDGWYESAKLIRKTHKSLLKQQKFTIQLEAYLLFLGEASSRAETSGLKYKYLYYRNLKRLINGPRKLLIKLGVL